MREEREQPFNKIVTFRMEDGQVVERSVEELPEDAFSEEPFETEKEKPERDEEGEGEPSPEKIQPELRAMMDERPYDRERVVINLLDDMTIPRFPQPVLGEPRDSEANREVARRAEELIAEITARRAGSYERLSQKLAENHGAETLEIYWLVKAMLVEMPLSAVPEMAERVCATFGCAHYEHLSVTENVA